MSRIALISDIHGNLPALQAVLADIKNKGINRIICLGDLVGKGPSSEAIVDIIKEKCELVLKGNWEYLVSDVHDNYFLEWHNSRLRDTQIEYLQGLPIYSEFYFSGKLIRVFHSSPKDVFRVVTLSSTNRRKMKQFKPPDDETQECDIAIYGHLHYSFIDNLKDKTLLNIGSVGNPLDIPQASYGIIEGKYGSRGKADITTMLVRVTYDIEKAIHQAVESGMPDLNAYINELETAKYRGFKRY